MIVQIIFTVIFFISTAVIVYVSISINKESKKNDHIHIEVIKECNNHDNSEEEIMLECDDFTVMVYLSIVEGTITGTEHMGDYETLDARDVKVIGIEATNEDGSEFELPEKTIRYINGYFNEWS